jgi:hypothetical protein
MPAPNPVALSSTPATLPNLMHLVFFAIDPRHELPLQVRFTGDFSAIAMGAQMEPAENQWVVVLAQHYYTREL